MSIVTRIYQVRLKLASFLLLAAMAALPILAGWWLFGSFGLITVAAVVLFMSLAAGARPALPGMPLDARNAPELATLTGDPLALAEALYAIEYRPRGLFEALTGFRVPAPAGDGAFRSHPPTASRIRRLQRLHQEQAGVFRSPEFRQGFQRQEARSAVEAPRPVIFRAWP
jgi:Zn-dependent protease with chaperone function